MEENEMLEIKVIIYFQASIEVSACLVLCIKCSCAVTCFKEKVN